MKNKIAIFLLFIVSFLFLSSCQDKKQDLPDIPSVPEGYEADGFLYLMPGEGVYALIEHEELNYKILREEIFNGKAQEIKDQYETAGNPEADPKGYTAIQNLVGIAEVYLGECTKAYERFNEIIHFVETHNLPEEKRILTALYNNAGAVTVNLSSMEKEDMRLKRAFELCEEPYMKLIIAVNLSSRRTLTGTVKEFGEIIKRSNEIIAEEKTLKRSPNYALFMAIKAKSVMYTLTSQESQAIKLLDEYIPQVPEAEEYKMIKAALFGLRGFCYDTLGEYQYAENDFQNAIHMAEQVVGEKNRNLAIEYHRLGTNYMAGKKYDRALACYERALPGYEEATPYEKETLYYNLGNACFGLEKYQESKEYFLKAYVNGKLVSEEVGDEKYMEDSELCLQAMYQLEEDFSLPFENWLEKELAQMEQEERMEDGKDGMGGQQAYPPAE